MRRAVLEETTRVPEKSAKAAAGTLVHDLLESCLTAVEAGEEMTPHWTRKKANEIRQRRAELIFEVSEED